jgi:cytidine deaminase
MPSGRRTTAEEDDVLTDDEYQMVSRVRSLIARRRGTASHAAGVLTRDGGVHLGVNLPHYSGGPCAEIAALARAVADSDEPPVSVVAARCQGVVSPCGRCRQMFYDCFPDIRIILDRDGDLFAASVLEMLPVP